MTKRRRLLRRRHAATCAPIDSVHNETCHSLTRQEISTLSRGFSFIPSRKPPQTKLDQDLEAFRRRVNLRLYWATASHPGTATRSWISKILPSTFKPPDYLPTSYGIWKTLVNSCQHGGQPHSNLSTREIRTWERLTSNPEFYVIQADKGGKTVLWNREEYEREALRQLQDNAVYQELSTMETDALLKDIAVEKHRIISELTAKNCINKSEARRLRNAPHQTPAIYFLPKIHKSRNSDSGTYVGRPIISACNGPLKPLDHFLARLTKNLLPLIPGSLRDTRDLLTTLEQLGPLPESASLFSADVEALYPSIDAEEGISASTRFYASHHHVVKAACREAGLLDPPDPKLFRRILTLIIRNNVFHFQHRKHFRQLNGTAMGASISVFFANSFMYYRTAHLVHTPPSDLVYFRRYIDDIIGIWTGDEKNIETTFNEVTDNSIRLTFVKDKNQLAALDVLILLRNGSIATKLYRKPTDSDQYIHWNSAHPIHLKKSIPYSQFLRVKRICSEEEDFEEETRRMMTRFRNRGFPERVLQTALRKARDRSRESLLENSPSRPVGGLHLVTDFFEPSARNIRESCNRFYQSLLTSAPITERQALTGTPIIPEENPVTAFRVGRRLGAALGPIYKKGGPP